MVYLETLFTALNLPVFVVCICSGSSGQNSSTVPPMNMHHTPDEFSTDTPSRPMYSFFDDSSVYGET